MLCGFQTALLVVGCVYFLGTLCMARGTTVIGCGEHAAKQIQTVAVSECALRVRPLWYANTWNIRRGFVFVKRKLLF